MDGCRGCSEGTEATGGIINLLHDIEGNRQGLVAHFAGHLGLTAVGDGLDERLEFALQGIAHLVGTAGAFQAASNGEVEEYLGGFWEISDPGLLRTVGVVWALLAVAFLVVAGFMWIGHRSWTTLLGYRSCSLPIRARTMRGRRTRLPPHLPPRRRPRWTTRR